MQNRFFIFLCICIIIVPFFNGTALATLGEPLSSLVSNRSALNSVHRSSALRSIYSVHEDVSDAARIRQYALPSGIVFAITWDGVSHPDLAPLLGRYDAEYRQVLLGTPRKHGRRQAQFRGSRVVVEKWGQMRNQQGRAYAPELLPPGVNLDEIR